jgi:hypothetical protein
VDLKNRRVEIELAMLERQEDDGNPVWWVGMLGEAFLTTLYEPLDWVFTFRDLVSGNPYALLGFLPLIPSAVGRLAKAVRYMDNIPEELASLARYADNLMSVTDDMLLPYADDTWAAIQRDAAWYQGYSGFPQIDSNGLFTFSTNDMNNRLRRLGGGETSRKTQIRDLYNQAAQVMRDRGYNVDLEDVYFDYFDEEIVEGSTRALFSVDEKGQELRFNIRLLQEASDDEKLLVALPCVP